jgi:hypothetical protein
MNRGRDVPSVPNGAPGRADEILFVAKLSGLTILSTNTSHEDAVQLSNEPQVYRV